MAGVSPRRRRWAAAAAAMAMALPLTACGGDGGPPVINLYYAPEENLPQVVEDCTEAAEGRYRIDYQVLPRGADDQRVQMVRRLAAEDTGHGRPRPGRHLDPGVRQRGAGSGSGPARTRPRSRRARCAGPLDTARYEGKLYAAPKNTNVQLLWYRTRPGARNRRPPGTR